MFYCSSEICFFERSLKIIGFILLWFKRRFISGLLIGDYFGLFGILPVHRENYAIDLLIFLLLINKLAFCKTYLIFLHSIPRDFPTFDNLINFLWEFIIKVVLQINLELSLIDFNFCFFVSE